MKVQVCTAGGNAEASLANEIVYTPKPGIIESEPFDITPHPPKGSTMTEAEGNAAYQSSPYIENIEMANAHGNNSGGYYTIGDLFTGTTSAWEGISWSSGDTFGATVTLKNVMAVTKVIINASTLWFANDFTVQGSLDGTSYTDVGTFIGPSTKPTNYDEGQYELSFEATRMKYIKIIIPWFSGSWSHSGLAGLSIFAKELQTMNSSTVTDASVAFDGFDKMTIDATIPSSLPALHTQAEAEAATSKNTFKFTATDGFETGGLHYFAINEVDVFYDTTEFSYAASDVTSISGNYLVSSFLNGKTLGEEFTDGLHNQNGGGGAIAQGYFRSIPTSAFPLDIFSIDLPLLPTAFEVYEYWGSSKEFVDLDISVNGQVLYKKVSESDKLVNPDQNLGALRVRYERIDQQNEPEKSFGYSLEHAMIAEGPWSVVDSDIATGTSVDVTITDPGFYRAKVQGTAGGVHITKAIANEIVYVNTY